MSNPVIAFWTPYSFLPVKPLLQGYGVRVNVDQLKLRLTPQGIGSSTNDSHKVVYSYSIHLGENVTLIAYHRTFGSVSRVTPIKSPATELDNESDGELGELEKMRETEFVGDVDAATGDRISREENVGGKREIAYSLAVWIWWFEFANELSMVKIAGYPTFSHEA